MAEPAIRGRAGHPWAADLPESRAPIPLMRGSAGPPALRPRDGNAPSGGALLGIGALYPRWYAYANFCYAN